MTLSQGMLFDDGGYRPPKRPPPVQPKRVGMSNYTTEDLLRLNTCKSRVLAFAIAKARAGEWFTNMDLLRVAGAIDAAKRRRELEHVDGYRFEKRQVGETNVLEFRLVLE